jgi:hypothetical protein
MIASGILADVQAHLTAALAYEEQDVAQFRLTALDAEPGPAEGPEGGRRNLPSGAPGDMGHEEAAPGYGIRPVVTGEAGLHGLLEDLRGVCSASSLADPELGQGSGDHPRQGLHAAQPGVGLGQGCHCGGSRVWITPGSVGAIGRIANFRADPLSGSDKRIPLAAR